MNISIKRVTSHIFSLNKQELINLSVLRVLSVIWNLTNTVSGKSLQFLTNITVHQDSCLLNEGVQSQR